MAERRERGTPRGGSRRSIDWGSLRGYVLDGTFALGELVFTVLAAGLVGGIFGSFIDIALVFLNKDWGGYGRIAGWTVAAVSTAVGMPLGWVSSDGRKWSLPTPRQLRKKVSVKTRKRQQKLSHDFRTLGDVLKGGAGFGLVGGVLGFALGSLLLMSWFSLAMSPLATTQWFQTLNFESLGELHENAGSAHSNDGGTVVTTDDPVAAYLFVAPILILGAACAIFGTAYGAVHYACYLRAVPADLRKREQNEKRKPVIEEREAIATAIEQRLPPLAPAPRKVPSEVRWQLLRQGGSAGFAIGSLLIVVGTVASALVFLGWRSDPARVPLIAITFGLIFVAVGALHLRASVRAWNGKIRILRHGHLARCCISTCLHPQKKIWRSYPAVLSELRAAWEKPLGDFNARAETKAFERFGILFSVGGIAVFGLIGLAGFVVTSGFLYAALVQRELVGWAGVGFLVLWWTLIVWLGRLFWTRVHIATTIERQSLKTLGIEPVVDCCVEFNLPGGKTVKAKTKLNLATRLTGGETEPDDVVAYDPWEPENVLLVSGLASPLQVDENGGWRVAESTSPI